MFPEENLKIRDSETSSKCGKKSFLFNFDTGDFTIVDGRLIVTAGIDAVKIWIEKILKTEKFKFEIYNTGEQEQYGISLLDFINSNYPLDFVKIEIERETKEALKRNTEILNVRKFEFTRGKRTLNCNFYVDTIYGEIGGEVKI